MTFMHCFNEFSKFSKRALTRLICKIVELLSGTPRPAGTPLKKRGMLVEPCQGFEP